MGLRSYYPLLPPSCKLTKIFDFQRRRGNVHEEQRRHSLYPTVLGQNARDPAQHPYRVSNGQVAVFQSKTSSTVSARERRVHHLMPFERFTELNSMAETCKDWSRIIHRLSFFEATWKPKSWSVRPLSSSCASGCADNTRDPCQLDLFIPYANMTTNSS